MLVAAPWLFTAVIAWRLDSYAMAAHVVRSDTGVEVLGIHQTCGYVRMCLMQMSPPSLLWLRQQGSYVMALRSMRVTRPLLRKSACNTR